MQKTKNEQQYPDIQIAVENFGPIEKAEIDLRPLTVFVGESNTGKTYLSALIYALHRIFDGFLRFPCSHNTVLLLNANHRAQRLTVSNAADVKAILEEFEKLDTSDTPLKFADLPTTVRNLLQFNLIVPGVSEDELKRCFDLESTSGLIRFADVPDNAMEVLLKVYREDQDFWSFNIMDSGEGITVDGSVNENITVHSEGNAALLKTLNIKDLEVLWREPMVEPAKSYYLPAARSGIMQSHGVIASSLIDSVTRIGLEHLPGVSTFSGMIADFLKHIINYKERDKSSDEMVDIANTLENEILRGKIEVNRLGAAGYPEFRYLPQKAEQALGMSRSSSMVSELAPLVLFLRGIVQPGDTLIIEEPESHLHPRAQTQIVLTLARLVRAGVRVIITTHSNWLLEQISNLVREGEVMKIEENQTESETWLTKEEVGAWWFRTDKPVEEISFEHIAGIEPEEYGEVAEELYNRSVDLRGQLEETAGGTEVEQE